MMRRVFFLASLVVALMICRVPLCQAQTGQAVLVTNAAAMIRLEPNAASAVVVRPPIGAILEVVAESGNWIQVKLPRDAGGFERLGFIQKSHVKVSEGRGGAAAVTAGRSDKASTGVAGRGVAEANNPAGNVEEPIPSSRGPTVAVLDFDFATVRKQFASWSTEGGLKPALDTWDVGKGIADLLIDELLSGGDVRLVERKRLDAVLREQDFSNSDRAEVRAAQVSQLRKALGVRYLITGSVTKFGGEEKTRGGIAGAVAGKVLLGGFGLKKTYANVGLTCRVVDSSTGEILASVKGEGKSSRQGLLLGGLGGGSGAIGGGGISMGSSDFQETILGEATNMAVKNVAAKLLLALKR